MKYLIIIYGTLFLNNANAFFDPFTIAAIASTVSSTLKIGQDVAGSMDAGLDLYREVEPDASISSSGQKMVENVDHIKTMALDLGYNASEISDVLNGKDTYYQGVEGDIRKLTRAIHAGKNIVKTLGGLEKKSQASNVESLEVQKQQLSTLNRILTEEQSQTLEPLKEKLEVATGRKKEALSLRKKLYDAGVKTYSKSSLLSFPITENIVNVSLEASKKLVPILFVILSIILGIRLIYYEVSLKDPSQYRKLISDLVLCVFLLGFYPDIIHLMMNCVETVANASSGLFGVNAYNIIDPHKFEPPHTDSGVYGFLKSVNFEWLRNWVIYLAYLWAQAMFNIGIGILVVMLPIVLLLGVMLGAQIAWQIYLGLILIFMMWPIMWNMVGGVGEMVWSSNLDALSSLILGIVLSILQIISPLITPRLLRGQTMGEAATGAMSHLKMVKGDVVGASRSTASAVMYSNDQISGRKGAGSAAAQSYDGSKMGKMAQGFTGFVMNHSSQKGVGQLIRGFKDSK